MRRFAVLALAVLTACGPKQPAVSEATVEPAAASSARAVQIVNATILANECQRLGRANAEMAEHAMLDLVEGCSSIPNGSARFEATLQTSGRIEIAAAPGQPGVVPICVLKHALVHKVPLSKPCRLDVRMEETRLPIRPDVGPVGGMH